MNKKSTAAKPAERPRAAKATAPEPEPIETAPEVALREIRVEDFARKAYEFFRVGQDGDFPEWDEVSQCGRNLYKDAARHVMDGGEPRTDFERTAVEVFHG